MSSMPANLKTIMEFDVDECIKEESYEVPLKGQYNEEKEGENWTLILGEEKCPNCNNRLKSKKIAQDGWRELIKCDKCNVMTKMCRERERTYTRTDAGAENTKFIEMYGNKEKRMHTLYQSCCILFHGSKKLHKKDHQQTNEIIEETKKDEDFVVVKSRRLKNKITEMLPLKKIVLLPAKVIAYSGVFETLARWNEKVMIELNVLRLGGNIFISQSSKYRKGADLTNKHYALVTSSIGGIEVCSVAEIDDRVNGHSIEEKSFVRCKKEGEVLDKVTPIAIKMVLGNIHQLKVKYADVEDHFSLCEGVFTSDSAEQIDRSEILQSAFTELHKSLDKIMKKVDKNQSSFYTITAGFDVEFQIESVAHVLKMGNVLSDFRELTTRLSVE